MIAKLHKKIAANKKTIADITEMAILAFDQRDEAQSKITAFQVYICYLWNKPGLGLSVHPNIEDFVIEFSSFVNLGDGKNIVSSYHGHIHRQSPIFSYFTKWNVTPRIWAFGGL